MTNKKEIYRVVLSDAGTRLTERCTRVAKGLYGDPLPEMVSRRLNLELKAIIDNQYSSTLLIGAELADCSRRAGYPVMSRGMAGSSLVAFLCGITSVNPLPAHYFCAKCHCFEVACDENNYRVSGFDLPQMKCPACGSLMMSDGHNIRPEFYLGWHLDKEPEIMLNFAPEIRPAIIRHIKGSYSEEQIFRAGTCSVDSNGIEKLGVHPAGIFILPGGVAIRDITQIRTDDADDGFQVDITVRDYHELYPALQRYDLFALPLLGLLHDLETATGVSEKNVPMTENVAEVFLNTDVDYIPLVSNEEKRAMRMLEPEVFSDIARVSGVLHGTDTWKDNAENLCWEGVELKDMISSRDDILQELICHDMDEDDAYDIMNHIRLGKGVTGEMKIKMMRDAGLPDWYVRSCEYATYLFPKSHIVEYTILEWKLAWYLTHYPEEYRRIYERWYDDITI